MIVFDEKEDMEKLVNNLRVDTKVSSRYTSSLTKLIIKYWDYVCLTGARYTILDYELGIEICASPPIYCCRLSYSPHETPIIMKATSLLIID